ncbi:fructosamine kinase family protein [Salana multivorans]
MTWTKVCSTPEAAAREEAGLRWLAAAEGGPAVVGVVERDGARLVLDRIRTARPTPEAARAFGAALARMHAAGAAAWGGPPPGTSGDGTIGAAVLRTPTTSIASWGELYARYRMVPHLEKALPNRGLTEREAAPIRKIVTALEAGELDHPQPALVGDRPARVHGDLWSGNVLSSDAGVVLIDPAAHGGHAETDLAMLALFGTPYLAEILAAYDDASPLSPGWQRRVPLHQLHPLLVHAELFGGGYGAQAVGAARRVLADW